MPATVSRPRAALMLAGVLAATGCGHDADADLQARGCLGVHDLATHGATYAGRDVPVCGWIDSAARDGRLRLTESMKPQTRVVLQLPAAPNGDAGVARVLDAVAGWRHGGRMPGFEGRYHGRLEMRRGGENVLHVARIDRLDGQQTE
ncbi:hypothetical protein [Lysobacter humi (ex Lee et al. 2017)]